MTHPALDPDSGSLTDVLAALRESETRFRQMAESINQVFFLRDVAMTRMFYVSPAYERVFGLSCASLYADPRSWVKVMHPDDLQRVRTAFMPDGLYGPFEVEFRIIRLDGTMRVIRSRGFPVYNDAGAIYRYASVAEDVTELKAIEARVRQGSRMEGLQQLASRIAHDFNNQLMVIIGHADLLAADSALSPDNRADLVQISKAAGTASVLAAQLVAFSREPEQGAELLDLNVIVGGMMDMIRGLVSPSVTIMAELFPELGLVSADRGQLEQLIINLVINARDALPDGGHILIRTSNCSLTGSSFFGDPIPQGDYVQLAVSDTGSAVNALDQGSLFEPFSASGDPSRQPGLGLAVVYGIARRSHGDIVAAANADGGTTFTLSLPIIAPSQMIG